MNVIFDLKDIGIGKRIFLVGNGPSLNNMNLDLLENEYSIAMNRIELLYPKTKWRPTHYVFTSSNCQDGVWGHKWSKSILNASNEEKTTPIIWRKFKDSIETNGNGKLPQKTIWLDSITEYPCGDDRQFSTDAVDRLDKSGTTMNVALQLAYYMNFDEVYVIGCDSNWITATNTINTAEGDVNHFHPDYHASIGNGEVEFNRMNATHKTAVKYFTEAGKKIYNAGYNSAITAYERKIFDDLFV